MSTTKRKESKIKQGYKHLTESFVKEERIDTYRFYADIVKQVGLNTKKLHPNYLKPILMDINKEIFNWIEKNPEGFEMPFQMGYMAVTKLPLIPFMDDKFEILERVKNLSEEEISDKFRAKVLAKYGKNISKVEAYEFMKRGKFINVVRWFNKRNCSIQKAKVWKFVAVKDKRRIIRESENKYYYWKFQDFYNYKQKVEDK
jgi:hypothetical protein